LVSPPIHMIVEVSHFPQGLFNLSSNHPDNAQHLEVPCLIPSAKHAMSLDTASPNHNKHHVTAYKATKFKYLNGNRG